MKTLRIFSIIGISFLTALVVLAVNLKNPLEQHYKNVLHHLMKKHGYESEVELLANHSSMTHIKNQLIRLKRHQYELHQSNFNHNVVSKSGSLALQKEMQTIKMLQKEIQQGLDQIPIKQIQVPQSPCINYYAGSYFRLNQANTHH